MSEKKVYEIMQVLNDKNNMEKDMQEVLDLVFSHFRGKYLERLGMAFDKCKENSVNNPSKEVALIHALKPFLTGEQQDKLGGIADTLTLLTTFDNIRKEAVQIEGTKLQAASVEELIQPVKDPAIHEDGIYEIDELCMLKKQKSQKPDMAGLMLVMSLIGKR
ncbi:MAG: hypothetical protein FWE24_01850 [Defluviitaleaceae bacterium]|nr:hypothetical protein [Defluviitaleaceae bacterium]